MEPKIGTVAPADPKAKEFLRNADPVMARLIDVHRDFRPRAWLDELPPLDAFVPGVRLECPMPMLSHSVRPAGNRHSSGDTR
jgi:hypothetical protein